MHHRDLQKTAPHRIYIQALNENGSSKDWKKSFLEDPNNKWLCDVPDEYINEITNTYGLADEIDNFNECKDIITHKIKSENIDPEKYSEVERNLPIAYGMIHARYIMSPDGIDNMTEKYKQKIFGTCPRYSCNNEPLLPIGISSQTKVSTVKVFCPCCRRIYEPRPPVSLDGAFFGPNVAHMLIDHLDILDHYLLYKPYVRTACGFKVYDPRFDTKN
ncbi:Casein kinase II regulatory subunit family protein [Trichomonas vaginalis G3]|uniref:Casein kinase II subunit beta n=1 Tax=Trichomonas vaginalis (strain ATCC PRA-98 / G3) TaxID=412133 RepID=A2EBP9_TRIV3|nr:protein kinase regulator protein [Trichomonas vaginalis G3]EAY09966.1 Casein kinase II regulatory subunit family protein [Trichomonas vaginalis G3]KAI5523122.1 protein kinase regulator protein [Trichomonas vaginalis G3]|eukprot:XP_001322189.1 Casein kinase II regulatory subunit family protein [Trichomonas vaginalis G3]